MKQSRITDHVAAECGSQIFQLLVLKKITTSSVLITGNTSDNRAPNIEDLVVVASTVSTNNSAHTSTSSAGSTATTSKSALTSTSSDGSCRRVILTPEALRPLPKASARGNK